MGLMLTDHFQPGSNVPRATGLPAEDDHVGLALALEWPGLVR